MDRINSLKNLQITGELTIIQHPILTKNRPEFSNKLMKLLFFLRHEGILRTFRKFSSKRIDEMNNIIQMTLLVYKENEKSYLNISLQNSTDSNDFVIENIFYRINPENINNLRINEKSISKYNYFVESNYSDFKIDQTDKISLPHKIPDDSQPVKTGVFLFGLGDYSRVYIARHLNKLNKIACVDYKSSLAKYYAKKFRFAKYAYTINDILPDIQAVEKPLIIIATYHSSHTDIAYDMFKQNRSSLIFIEKPPCVTLDDLSKLISLYTAGAKIEIGFNRRFIKYNQYIKNQIKKRKAYITISVKEVLIDQSHWYLWNNQGTRITGNLIHWIDLCNYFTASMPVELTMLSGSSNDESLALSILYQNGSLANITVTDAGNSLRGVQEKLEIRYASETIFIDDYLNMSHIRANGKKKLEKKIIRDKGHDEMYKHLIDLYKFENTTIYTLSDLIYTTVVTYYATEMFKTKCRNKIIGNDINNYLDMIPQ